MSSGPQPLVSIVTVNYNGRELLPGLLSRIENQSYERRETLVVDNASTDGSTDLVRREFPWVELLEATENLGFARGNNLGIRASRGDYVVLVNNDTLPDPDWLLHLVEEARSSDRIAAVGSKILFAKPFLPVKLRIDSEDLRPEVARVFVSEQSGFRNTAYAKRVFGAGFRHRDRLDDELGHWMGDEGELYLPFERSPRPDDLVLRLLVRDESRPDLRVSVGDECLARHPIGNGWRDVAITVPTDLARAHGLDVINNAGSFLRPDGAAGDRGIFEPDRGQFDEAEDVTALCGCSMLLSRKAIAEVGSLDEDFFMYFEDTELSWRLRNAGYRLRYQPRSVIRHFHASTSREWSPLFNFFVARNRILMLLKHGSGRAAARAYVQELGMLLRLLLRHRSLFHVDVKTRLAIQASLLKKAPKAALKRLGLMAD